MSKSLANPLIEELMVMKQRMDALYAENFHDVQEQTESQNPAADWAPLMDIWETDDFWTALVDLPGVSEEDLKLEIDNNTLMIKGIRTVRAPFLNTLGLRVERPEGHFHRSVTLPEQCSRGQIKAQLDRGVLTIEIPKNAKPARKITVRRG